MKLNQLVKSIILTEGRKEDVRRKYPHSDDDIFNYAVTADPSGNQKYLHWVMKEMSYLTDTALSYQMSEVGEIMNLVKFFHNNQNSFKMRDINQYDSVYMLSSAVDGVKQRQEEKKVSKDADKVYEDENWLVMSPKTWEASCMYGAGTKWCTTQKNSDTYWKKETRNAIMYYIIDKNQTQDSSDEYKVALQYFFNGTKRFWNAPDLDITRDYELPQELIEPIQKHYDYVMPILKKERGGSDNDKINVLADHLNINVDDIVGDGIDYETTDDGEYRVMTYEEADDELRGYWEDRVYDEEELQYYVDVTQYAYMTETDRRMWAQEESNYYIDDMSDDDVYVHFDLMEDKEWFDRVEERLEEIRGEMRETEDEETYTELEEEMDGLKVEYSDLNDKLDIDSLREKWREEIYEYEYDCLEDPLRCLVDERGWYSSYGDALKNVDSIRIDTDEIVNEFVNNGDYRNMSHYDGEYHEVDDFIIIRTN